MPGLTATPCAVRSRSTLRSPASSTRWRSSTSTGSTFRWARRPTCSDFPSRAASSGPASAGSGCRPANTGVSCTTRRRRDAEAASLLSSPLVASPATPTASNDPAPAAPIVRRCWAGLGASQLMLDYHDREWGVPLHGDRELFAELILDGFQAGLVWAVVP